MPVRLYEHKLRRELYRKNTTFSKNIRFLRLAHGYNQGEIADHFHIARSTYYAMEHGGSPPHIGLAIQIADFYNVNLDYLISFDIAEQLLALIRPEREDVDGIKFIEKWLTLSQAGREQIVNEMKQIYDEEKRYRRFPWKYVDPIDTKRFEGYYRPKFHRKEVKK